MKTILMSGLLLLIATGIKAQSENRLLKEARKEIEAADLIFSDLINKKDGSVTTLYTNDACLFPSNRPPVVGKERIAKFYAKLPKVHTKLMIQHLYGDAKEYVTDESFYTITDVNGNTIDEGKAIVVWKKTAGGWKMYRDMFSSNGKINTDRKAEE